MSARVRVGALVFLLGGAFVVSGCPGEPPLLRVDVCGDVSVPVQVDAVRVSVLDSNRVEVASGVRQLVECPADRLKTLPQVFEFTPPLGEVRVIAQALKDGVEIARSERSVQDASEGAEVRVALQQVCIGLSCPLGRTCVDGACELVSDANGTGCSSPSAPAGDAGVPQLDAGSPPDEEPDAGADAGPTSLYCDPVTGGEE